GGTEVVGTHAGGSGIRRQLRCKTDLYGRGTGARDWPGGPREYVEPAAVRGGRRAGEGVGSAEACNFRRDEPPELRIPPDCARQPGGDQQSPGSNPRVAGRAGPGRGIARSVYSSLHGGRAKSGPRLGVAPTCG